MKVLVCGDRNWTDYGSIKYALLYVGATHVVEGDARGADRIAGEVAKDLGLELSVYPADWGKYGRAAGPIRNRQQLDTEEPDIVLAFHQNIAESKGTKDMVKYAKSKGYEVHVISKYGVPA